MEFSNDQFLALNAKMPAFYKFDTVDKSMSLEIKTDNYNIIQDPNGDILEIKTDLEINDRNPSKNSSIQIKNSGFCRPKRKRHNLKDSKSYQTVKKLNILRGPKTDNLNTLENFPDEDKEILTDQSRLQNPNDDKDERQENGKNFISEIKEGENKELKNSNIQRRKSKRIIAKLNIENQNKEQTQIIKPKNPKQSKLFNSIKGILQVLFRHPMAGPFSNELDLSSLTDYYSKIENPIQLLEIKEKHQNNEYQNIQLFADDIRLL